MAVDSTNLTGKAASMEAMRDAWGWFLAMGIILIILGIVAIGVPIAVSVTMTVFLGIIIFIAAVVQLIQAIAAHRWNGFFIHILGAVIYGIFAIALLGDPSRGVRALTLLLAMYFLISGFFKILLAVISHGTSNWGWILFSGTVNFILGALIWSQWPSNSDWVIGLLVGIELLISGWSMLMLSIAAKSVPADFTG
ncbi:acid-resistance membrane protein [bacterium BMS3Abin01]|nr:acid-resistance membrane protein [bacterium BMS3Abin01]HDZ59203.1 HdeD family acid-resistance protein [Actinomycetota bacterium]